MQAEALIENVGYPDYIVDTEYMARKYKEVCLDPIFYIFLFRQAFLFRSRFDRSLELWQNAY